MSDQFCLPIENPFLNLGRNIYCKFPERALSPSASPKVVKGRARKSWINRAPASKAAPPRTTGTLTTLGDFECPFAAMMDVQKIDLFGLNRMCVHVLVHQSETL